MLVKVHSVTHIVVVGLTLNLARYWWIIYGILYSACSAVDLGLDETEVGQVLCET